MIWAKVQIMKQTGAKKQRKKDGDSLGTRHVKEKIEMQRNPPLVDIVVLKSVSKEREISRKVDTQKREESVRQAEEEAQFQRAVIESLKHERKKKGKFSRKSFRSFIEKGNGINKFRESVPQVVDRVSAYSASITHSWDFYGCQFLIQTPNSNFPLEINFEKIQKEHEYKKENGEILNRYGDRCIEI